MSPHQLAALTWSGILIPGVGHILPHMHIWFNKTYSQQRQELIKLIGHSPHDLKIFFF
jgi:hypothetical protein